VSSPYRESPLLLLCPRCGDVLDRVFAGVAACPRCQGAWINQSTLDTAFGNPRWPQGQNLWWHAELECPECATEGTKTKMDARSANEVMVDLCPSHGLWLDQGELGRLMGLAEGSDELLELQKRVTAIAPDPDELASRRVAWRTELDVRRRAASEFRSWVEQEQKRKAAEAAAIAAQRAVAAEEERRKRKEEAIEAQKVAAARRSADTAGKQAMMELGQERARQINVLRRLEKEMFDKREELVRLQGEAEIAKRRVREIDAQLDAGEPDPQ
jgi:Zn-finger nucleic acid-binding protein